MTALRLREDILSLDSAQSLTQGSQVGVQAALAVLIPTRSIYTAITRDENGGQAIIGQMSYAMGSRSARLSFLTPGRRASSPLLPGLLEHLAHRAGEWGAFHVLCDVDELSPAFESLRKTGFTVYAWQRVWKLDPIPPQEKNQTPPAWQPVSSIDEPAVRSLFQNLVPPLIQSAEPLPNRRLGGLAYRQDGEIMAYVEGTTGPRGLFLHPLVHPDLTEYGELVRSLMYSLPRLARPVYLAVRSYQSWLENALMELPAQASPRHALLVKHLATLLRVPLSARLGVEKRSSEVPTISIVNHFDVSETPSGAKGQTGLNMQLPYGSAKRDEGI